MLSSQTTTNSPEWQTGVHVWDTFTDLHPELGLNKGKWAFHNFLRPYRQALVQADAIRLVRNRFWLAHQDRFYESAFECATGRSPNTMKVRAPATAKGLKNPAVGVSPKKVHPIMCQGLTAHEFFRLHRQLPTACLEQVLDQNAGLMAANDAVVEAWPGVIWNAGNMTEADLDRLELARLALVEVNHGNL